MMASVSTTTRRRLRGRLALGWMVGALLAGPVLAQAPGTPSAPAAGQAAQPAQTPSNQWQELPPMVVERVFRGPLRDTLVQRLRDPVDGATCFIFLPMSAGVTGQGQFLVYGPNTIGSISCFAPAQVIQLQPLAPPPAQPAPPPARSR